MKQLILILVLFTSSLVTAQKLSYKENFFGSKSYYKGNEKISEYAFKQILLQSPEAEAKYKSYKLLKNVALAIDIASIACTVYYFSDTKNNKDYIVPGLTFALSALLIDITATQKLKSSLDLANEGVGFSYRF